MVALPLRMATSTFVSLQQRLKRTVPEQDGKLKTIILCQNKQAFLKSLVRWTTCRSSRPVMDSWFVKRAVSTRHGSRQTRDSNERAKILRSLHAPEKPRLFCAAR